MSLLEFEVINLTLLNLHKKFPLKVIHFQVGKGTALSFLMRMAGTFRWEATAITKDICDIPWYLPVELNVREDWTSRNPQDSRK